MSEVSLIQQIKNVQGLRDYIKLSVDEVDSLNTEMDKWVTFLRQEGMTMEIADKFEGPMYMGQVFKMLDELKTRISEEDYRYLSEVQRKLEESLD